MAATGSPVVLPSRVQELLDMRQKHMDSIEGIDDILAKINSALGVSPGKKRGPKPSTASSTAPTGKKRGRRRGKRFGVSAEEMVLAYIKQSKNPTTQEINKHWKAQGRGGSADNSLSKLFREKQVKREPLVGMRGSRYSIIA